MKSSFQLFFIIIFIHFLHLNLKKKMKHEEAQKKNRNALSNDKCSNI